MTGFKEFNTSIINEFDSNTLKATKGILILLVILGHNTVISGVVFPIQMFIANFHVACFLLLPFIYNIKPLTKKQTGEWFVRYFTPFVIFLLLDGILFFTFIEKGENRESWITNMLMSLSIQSSEFTNLATGLQSLWFLPVLFTTVIGISLFCGLGKITGFLLLLVISGLIHCLAGAIPAPYKYHLPFGLILAAFHFFIGVLVRSIFIRWSVIKVKKWSFLFFGAFIVLQALALLLNSRIGYSRIQLYDFSAPLFLLLHDGIIVFSFLFLTTTSLFRTQKWLIWLGKYSLPIYLLHQVIFQVLLLISRKTAIIYPEANSQSESLLFGFLLFLATVMIASLIAWVLFRISWIKKLIFPRNIDDWRDVLPSSKSCLNSR